MRCSRLLKRRATTKSWKLAPSLRVAAKIRPYFILALDGGPATAFGFGFVWPDFRSQAGVPSARSLRDGVERRPSE